MDVIYFSSYNTQSNQNTLLQLKSRYIYTHASTRLSDQFVGILVWVRRISGQWMFYTIKSRGSRLGPVIYLEGPITILAPRLEGHRGHDVPEPDSSYMTQ